MKKRILSLLLVLVMAVGCLAACGGAKNAEANFDVPEGGYDGSEVTITFYHTMGANLSTVLDNYILEDLGYQKTENELEADVVVFNTCCIRENAERRAYGNIGALKKHKLKNKDVIIAVGGCMPQQKGKAEEIKKTFPFVDIVFGTHNLSCFKDFLIKRIEKGKKLIEISKDEYAIYENTPVKRKSYPSAWVNVMYGCNNFCSYCIVPYVRGRERSRTPENIINEVKDLVSKGYKEINLLGQNVDSYGKDLTPVVDFSDLLKMVNDIELLFEPLVE